MKDNFYNSVNGANHITQELICKDYLPLVKNNATLLLGRGAIGKTWLGLNVAIHCAIEGYKVLYWTREEQVGYLKHRINMLIEHFYEDKQEFVRQNLYFSDSKAKISASFLSLLKDVDVLILDPLIDFCIDYAKSGKDKSQAVELINMVISACQTNSITALLINSINIDPCRFLDYIKFAYEMMPVAKNDKTYDIYMQREIVGLNHNSNTKLILTIKPKPSFPELLVET